MRMGTPSRNMISGTPAQAPDIGVSMALRCAATRTTSYRRHSSLRSSIRVDRAPTRSGCAQMMERPLAPGREAFPAPGGRKTPPVVPQPRTPPAATHLQTFATSSLFTATDPDADPVMQYDLWDSGAGGGHWLLNGTALASGQDNFVSA